IHDLEGQPAQSVWPGRRLSTESQLAEDDLGGVAEGAGGARPEGRQSQAAPAQEVAPADAIIHGGENYPHTRFLPLRLAVYRFSSARRMKRRGEPNSGLMSATPIESVV